MLFAAYFLPKPKCKCFNCVEPRTLLDNSRSSTGWLAELRRMPRMSHILRVL